METRKQKRKILIIMPDRKKADEIAICLTQSGFEVTDIVPYLYNALHSIERIKPELLIIETDIKADEATFIYTYLKIPLVLISNQRREELQSFCYSINLLEIIHKPFSLYEVVFSVVRTSPEN
ncbi:MAG: hypothetical protein WCM76_09740 [Bacteroidota bacterium]